MLFFFLLLYAVGTIFFSTTAQSLFLLQWSDDQIMHNSIVESSRRAPLTFSRSKKNLIFCYSNPVSQSATEHHHQKKPRRKKNAMKEEKNIVRRGETSKKDVEIAHKSKTEANIRHPWISYIHFK